MVRRKTFAEGEFRNIQDVYGELFLKLSFTAPREYLLQFFGFLYNCSNLNCRKMQQNNLIFLHLGFQYSQEYTHTSIPSFTLLRTMCSESILIFNFSLNLPNCSACQELLNETASYFREHVGKKNLDTLPKSRMSANPNASLDVISNI